MVLSAFLHCGTASGRLTNRTRRPPRTVHFSRRCKGFPLMCSPVRGRCSPVSQNGGVRVRWPVGSSHFANPKSLTRVRRCPFQQNVSRFSNPRCRIPDHVRIAPPAPLGPLAQTAHAVRCLRLKPLRVNFRRRRFHAEEGATPHGSRLLHRLEDWGDRGGRQA